MMQHHNILTYRGCRLQDGFCEEGGKIGVPDHPVPIFVDHHIYLSIYKESWSVCSGADWSKCPACPDFTKLSEFYHWLKAQIKRTDEESDSDDQTVTTVLSEE